jgi:hypothetical protein
MTETVIILDEEESRRATEQQMAETAWRFGVGGNRDAITQPGGPLLSPLLPPQSPMQSPGYPLNPTPAALPVQVAPEHLLMTPSARPGRVRLVRMQGSIKLGNWTVDAVAAATVASILQAFGVTLTDLREGEDDEP